MSSANSSAFIQGADDINSAAQMCPLQQKTVSLYPVRWAVCQEQVDLPSNFEPPSVATESTHYCLRQLTVGWIYMYSEVFGALYEYQVNDNGIIAEVRPGVNSVLSPEADAEPALPCIHHPAEGNVYLKFSQHRWTVRLQELARTDSTTRDEYMESFSLGELPETGLGRNIIDTDAAGQTVEDFKPQPIDFGWSLSAFAKGLKESDLQGLSKKATEFSYCIALNDETGIAAELGQLHALYVNLIMNYTEENAYAYTTAQMVDALIAREASKKEDKSEQEEVKEELKERIRSSDKDAFVDQYHSQLTEYDEARGGIFEDWKRWIDSTQLSRALEFNDLYSVEGFEAAEQELSDVLDGYVSAEKGKEDAESWMAQETGTSIIGDTLKSVLFLASSTNKITEKLKDLPDFDYGSLKIVNSLQEIPGYLTATIATDNLLLEFAAPAAQMGVWAANRQSRPQWKKWIKRVSERYNIELHEHGISLDTATNLLLKVNRDALAAASGYSFSDISLSPMAIGIMETSIRDRLRSRLIDVFYLDPSFKDNPFGWLHTRLDPVVKNIKEHRGKFIGAVTFFQAFNMVNLFSGLRETNQDVMLADQKVIDKWLPFADCLWSVAEGMANLSGLLIRSEYAKTIGLDLSATGARVSVTLRSVTGLKTLSTLTKFLSRAVVKFLPYVGTILAIGVEGRAALKSYETGHNAAAALALVQVGLTIGIGYLTALALAGTASLVGAPVVLLGAVLVVISIVVTAIQLYIARSRIENFLSQSFWGNAPTLQYWDDQSRPSTDKLLSESRTINSSDGNVVRDYFEAELDAFYYMLFSPIVRITEHMPKHGAITRQGEYKVLSELTSFKVFFPGYDPSSCVVSIRLYEANKNIIFDDEFRDISELFRRRSKSGALAVKGIYEFTNYNHGSWDRLELLIEYVKDGRKITGDNGLRIVLDGNDVEELGVDERLTFEL